MGLTDRLKAVFQPSRAMAIPSWPSAVDNFWPYANVNGGMYPLSNGFTQTINGHVEDIPGDFRGLATQAFGSNVIVFAVMLARLQLFTEARFQFQELRGGRPGKLFGSPDLAVLETPWPNGTTADLLARMIQDTDLAGNFFGVRRAGNTLRRLPPDWVEFILGSERDPDIIAGDIDAEVLGYVYYPDGKYSGRDPEFLLRSQVAHWAPIPDPLASFRGMSWLTPVLREISADKAMTEHKLAFLANGGTPNIVISLDKDMAASQSTTAFAEWIELFKKANPTNGWDKFRTMYLAGGTDMKVVGTNWQEADLKNVQGAGETRIAAAGGVPPIIVGLSEGLQAATYSNYGQARRRFADNTMRPLWRGAAGALEDVVPAPKSTRLWYDDRDIQALAEDKKDLAEVRQFEAQQIRTLVDGGYTPESVVEAVTTGDFTRLVHTGLYSVQLQPPGTVTPKPPETPIPPPEPKRDALLLQVVEASERRAAAAEQRADQPAIVNVHPANIEVHTPEQPVHVTVEPTVVNVTTPEIRNEFTVEPAPVTVQVEPTPLEVTVENTVEPTPVEIRNEVTVEPTPVEITNTIEPTPVSITNELPAPTRTTKVVKRDKTGAITHIEES